MKEYTQNSEGVNGNDSRYNISLAGKLFLAGAVYAACLFGGADSACAAETGARKAPKPEAYATLEQKVKKQNFNLKPKVEGGDSDGDKKRKIEPLDETDYAVPSAEAPVNSEDRYQKYPLAENAGIFLDMKVSDAQALHYNTLLEVYKDVFESQCGVKYAETKQRLDERLDKSGITPEKRAEAVNAYKATRAHKQMTGKAWNRLSYGAARLLADVPLVGRFFKDPLLLTSMKDQANNNREVISEYINSVNKSGKSQMVLYTFMRGNEVDSHGYSTGKIPLLSELAAKGSAGMSSNVKNFVDANNLRVIETLVPLEDLMLELGLDSQIAGTEQMPLLYTVNGEIALAFESMGRDERRQNDVADRVPRQNSKRPKPTKYGPLVLGVSGAKAAATMFSFSGGGPLNAIHHGKKVAGDKIFGDQNQPALDIGGGNSY